jgi:hypothetical protein
MWKNLTTGSSVADPVLSGPAIRDRNNPDLGSSPLKFFFANPGFDNFLTLGPGSVMEKIDIPDP